MAEIIGVVSGTITLCTLLKTCLDAFDMIKEGKAQELTFRKLLVRLNIERVRLYTWGEAAGLTYSPSTKKPNIIGNETVVKDALEIITRLLLDAGKIQARYGCLEADSGDLDDEAAMAQGPVVHLVAPFSHADITAETKVTSKGKEFLSKTRWVIHDKDKFEDLIQEIKTYVDGIYSITKPLSIIAAAEQSAKYGLYKIEDVKTLEMVSVACQVDYPSFSDTASLKVELLSQTSSRKDEIRSWINKISVTNASHEMINVPVLDTRRTRATYYGGPEIRLTQEASLDIETLIKPLTDEEMNRVDDVILKYLDYRHFTGTAATFRREIQSERFDETFVERQRDESPHARRQFLRPVYRPDYPVTIVQASGRRKTKEIIERH
ncbi:prion-inhibition and propagation-domain-containing protein [Xylogone sp. PMI_703]|nr:prion-inhibition and propagation-domain-containing protein [Xylogone sp. PMI_703]